MVSRRFRPRPASLPTRFPRRSSWRRATKRRRCCRRSPRPARIRALPLGGTMGKGAEVDRKDVVLVIDNYDSFTYNLVQYLGELGEYVVVHRNDEISLEDINRLSPLAAVLSDRKSVV